MSIIFLILRVKVRYVFRYILYTFRAKYLCTALTVNSILLFFSLDRPMTKNLLRNTKCQPKFLFHFDRIENSLASKLQLTFGVTYCVFSSEINFEPFVFTLPSGTDLQFQAIFEGNYISDTWQSRWRFLF